MFKGWGGGEHGLPMEFLDEIFFLKYFHKFLEDNKKE
jgi:hypothetical protein